MTQVVVINLDVSLPFADYIRSHWIDWYPVAAVYPSSTATAGFAHALHVECWDAFAPNTDSLWQNWPKALSVQQHPIHQQRNGLQNKQQNKQHEQHGLTAASLSNQINNDFAELLETLRPHDNALVVWHLPSRYHAHHTTVGNPDIGQTAIHAWPDWCHAIQAASQQQRPDVTVQQIVLATDGNTVPLDMLPSQAHVYVTQQTHLPRLHLLRTLIELHIDPKLGIFRHRRSPSQPTTRSTNQLTGSLANLYRHQTAASVNHAELHAEYGQTIESGSPHWWQKIVPLGLRMIERATQLDRGNFDLWQASLQTGYDEIERCEQFQPTISDRFAHEEGMLPELKPIWFFDRDYTRRITRVEGEFFAALYEELEKQFIKLNQTHLHNRHIWSEEHAQWETELEQHRGHQLGTDGLALLQLQADTAQLAQTGQRLAATAEHCIAEMRGELTMETRRNVSTRSVSHGFKRALFDEDERFKRAMLNTAQQSRQVLSKFWLKISTAVAFLLAFAPVLALRGPQWWGAMVPQPTPHYAGDIIWVGAVLGLFGLLTWWQARKRRQRLITALEAGQRAARDLWDRNTKALKASFRHWELSRAMRLLKILQQHHSRLLNEQTAMREELQDLSEILHQHADALHISKQGSKQGQQTNIKTAGPAANDDTPVAWSSYLRQTPQQWLPRLVQDHPPSTSGQHHAGGARLTDQANESPDDMLIEDDRFAGHQEHLTSHYLTGQLVLKLQASDLASDLQYKQASASVQEDQEDQENQKGQEGLEDQNDEER